MEDQIRAELARLRGVTGFRVSWVWLPPWRPAGITGERARPAPRDRFSV
jgi:metal-sulfur cluster biosynthetic enzyme